MKFEVGNGIRISCRREEEFNRVFSKLSNGNFVVGVTEDILVEFKDGKFVEAFELPF